MPARWLQTVAVVSLVLAGLSAAVIVVDIRGRGYRQPMAVMEWVWPITALHLGPFGLAFYWIVGRTASPRWREEHGERTFPYWFLMQIGMFLMQIGMAIGLATSYPMNRVLIARGVKEVM